MPAKTKELKLDKAIDAQALYREIDRLVESLNITYGDAILHYCERSGMEVETVGEVCRKSPKIVAQLQNEFEALHMLPKTARLPL